MVRNRHLKPGRRNCQFLSEALLWLLYPAFLKKLDIGAEKWLSVPKQVTFSEIWMRSGGIGENIGPIIPQWKIQEI